MNFDAVFVELREPIFKLCFRMLGNRHEAEDAVQDTFVAVHRGLETFRGEASVKTWVYRIAIRAALKVRADRRVSEPLEDGRAGSVAPEAALQARDDSRRLQIAMAQLPAEHRAVLSLSALDGVSHREIAEVLGIPFGTVGSRLHAARKKLMVALG